MYVELHPDLAANGQAQQAGALTNACVHCGFCLATCPTYLDTRDERDSPRGRIYLIKQLLETGSATRRTHTHLDRCLTCRSCETTCPSGMQYGDLLDIGRGLMEQRVPRPPASRVLRRLLRFVIASPGRFALALRLGQLLRPLLPAELRSRIPARRETGTLPTAQHSRSMLVLAGCVQQAATPNTNAAARRVFDRLGITLQAAADAGCCGAVNYHLAAHAQGLDDMRRNIDAWWPYIENGAEAIVSSATGCGSMLADYGRLLADDPAYSVKAQRVSALARDIGEILQAEDLGPLTANTAVGKVAVQIPCSLHHGLQQPDLVTDIMRRVGFELALTSNNHLCCGSAGTYSILQPQISRRLRDNKLHDLGADQPTLIATANVGCQLQLQSGSQIPVKHWIELLDQQ